ncbi:lipoprotein N-acyltransferase Lnb domain-containing protein [Chryseosolibacter indicus]|uniref:DUF4105 domain-containing protein n=1 Tax=Chryseosolibacter indicus TaxID=2782351 RepID=A0ABS5VS65_9BACT|nr:DUF4105 domain-containing protein [Chryseosolibacter indicus]MBT1704278.1 DUF4105 domain-containing protein [Chryseosolibacter indicus]
MRILLLPLLFICSLTFGQVTLSEDAQISVITCGPWQGELYSAFGHSAFRVHDPVNGIDEAYNYGVFDFDQPNFYLNFARGYLYYKLGVYDYKRFEYYYIYHNRYVHEQVLNLSGNQKQRLYDYLSWNALPENENYRYDYFYNNCATKMRDVVKEVFKDSIHFDGSYIKTDYTIRELTDLYLTNQPWGDLGIDICLGLPMDKKAAPQEYMFLPDYVESAFAHATIKDGNQTKPLVAKLNSVYESTPETFSKGLFQPLYVFGVLSVIAVFISYRDFKKQRITHVFDITLFTVLGMIGLLLLFLWIATDHQAAARNMNLLWALPTHLVAVIAFIKQPRWLSTYFLFAAIISVILILCWAILPQKLHYALIPVVLTIALRATVQFWVRKKTLTP